MKPINQLWQMKTGDRSIMKTIALIDPHCLGHHYAFIRLFAKYFLKDGNRVCIFYPENEKGIRAYLHAEGFDDGLIFFEKSSLKKKITSNEKIWDLPLATWRLWRSTGRLLKHAEKKHDLKFDFVFFAWLDDYLCNYLHHVLVDISFKYKWSGLYFHPWYLNSTALSDRITFSSVDSVLRAKGCQSVALHDEFNVEKLFNRIKKKVVVFPEIADSTPPENNYNLAIELAERANGRSIVGLIGISHRKGFPTFIDVIKNSDSSKFFFFFCGPLETDQLSATDREKASAFLKAIPSNCIYYPNYLEEGAKLNAIINTFDILFLVYNDFQSSSNFITKAAIFKKLVLSTERFWMGRVTKKYHLGATCAEGQGLEATQWLEAITKDKEQFQRNAQWREYLLVHDEKNLSSVMHDVLIG